MQSGTEASDLFRLNIKISHCIPISKICTIDWTSKPQMEFLTLWLSPKDLLFAFACDFLPYFRIELCGVDVSADQVQRWEK
jgi:hypothetical protein